MRRSTSRSSQADRRTGGQTLWFALLVLSASPPIRLSAQELANNAGALFLLFPVGAQAVAMGQTAATLDGRGEAAFWNPAGLARAHGLLPLAPLRRAGWRGVSGRLRRPGPHRLRQQHHRPHRPPEHRVPRVLR